MRRLRQWLTTIVLCLALAVAGCGDPPLVGSDLGGRPAPDFRLTDQTGRSVTLGDFAGKAVALTFLYSTCPDTCPLMAAKLRQVHDQLSDDAARVELVVISVDPERDTIDQLAAFTRTVDMEGRWRFLTGPRQALGPVWAAYGIGVLPGPAGTIGHTDALFVIDRQGRQRLLMRPDLNPADLAANLRTLSRR